MNLSLSIGTNKSKNTAIISEIIMLYITDRSLYFILYGINKERVRIDTVIMKIYGKPIETVKRYVEHIIIAERENKKNFECILFIIVLLHY